MNEAEGWRLKVRVLKWTQDVVWLIAVASFTKWAATETVFVPMRDSDYCRPT